MIPYLSSTLFANRAAALAGVLEVTGILVQAGERYTALVMESGRQALSLGDRGLEQPARWLELSGGASTHLLEQAYEIACDTHAALIAAGDAQVRRFDEVVRGILTRAADWSPWESAVAFDALRTSLDSAENTIHEMSEVATQTIEVAEKEARLIAEAVAPTPAARARKRA